MADEAAPTDTVRCRVGDCGNLIAADVVSIDDHLANHHPGVAIELIERKMGAESDAHDRGGFPPPCYTA